VVYINIALCCVPQRLEVRVEILTLSLFLGLPNPLVGLWGYRWWKSWTTSGASFKRCDGSHVASDRGVPLPQDQILKAPRPNIEGADCTDGSQVFGRPRILLPSLTPQMGAAGLVVRELRSMVECGGSSSWKATGLMHSTIRNGPNFL
jgi:hypothetical protein